MREWRNSRHEFASFALLTWTEVSGWRQRSVTPRYMYTVNIAKRISYGVQHMRVILTFNVYRYLFLEFLNALVKIGVKIL